MFSGNIADEFHGIFRCIFVALPAWLAEDAAAHRILARTLPTLEGRARFAKDLYPSGVGLELRTTLVRKLDCRIEVYNACGLSKVLEPIEDIKVRTCTASCHRRVSSPWTSSKGQVD